MSFLRVAAILVLSTFLFSGSVHAFSFGQKTPEEMDQKLEEAQNNGKIENAQKWLDKGARPTEIFDGKLGLWLVDHPNVVWSYKWNEVEEKLLADKSIFEVRDSQGHSIYHLSTDEYLLQATHEAGLDVDIRNAKGRTALMMPLEKAIRLQFEMMAEGYRGSYGRDSDELLRLYDRIHMFLSWGAQIDAKDNLGWSPLVARDSSGNGVLHGIASEPIAKAILDTGFPVDDENNEGNTPLYYVFPRAISELVPRYSSGRVFRFDWVFSLVPLFLKEGANPDHKNNEGQKTFEHWPIWKTIPGWGENRLVHILIRNDNFELIQQLSEQIPFKPGPIYAALDQGRSIDEIRLLAESCRPKELRSFSHGELGSVVHAAIRLGRLDVAKMFHKDFDFPVGISTWEGEHWFTPLAAAFLYAPENQDEIVEYYIAHKEDVVEVAKHLAALAEERAGDLEKVRSEAKRQRQNIWNLQAANKTLTQERNRARLSSF